MQNRKTWYYLIGAAALLLVIKYSDSILHLLGLLFAILQPVLVGCAIAYVLNILVTCLEKLPPLRREGTRLYRHRRVVSISGALVIIVLVLILLVTIIIPQLVDAFGVVFRGIPPMLDALAVWIGKQDFRLPEIETWLNSLDVNWPQLIQKGASYLTSGVSSFFTSAFSLLSNVGGTVVEVVIGFIFALYLLAGKERLARQLRSVAQAYLKPSVCDRLLYVLATAHETFTKFFIGQFTEAIVIGVLCTVGMWLFRFPYATMIGTLVGATALLPVVGAYLGAFIGAFMILTINPMQAIGFLIFIAVLQQLEGNLIYPRVVGSSIGLPGIWVLTAVTLGGGIGGIAGMLLAVPITATIYKLLQRDVRKKNAVTGGQTPEPALPAQPDADTPSC